MNYVYIEDSRLESLAQDLAVRVHSFLKTFTPPGSKYVYVVGIGESGLKIAAAFSKAFRREVTDEVKIVLRTLDKSVSDSERSNEPQKLAFSWTNSEANSDEPDCKSLIEAQEFDHVENKVFLLMDGVVRTGRTLLSAYKSMLERVQKSDSPVLSYAVAVNPDSGLIPTWFGTLYSPDKYVILSRDQGTPNVSLLEVTKEKSKNQSATRQVPYDVTEEVMFPPVVLRAPDEEDTEFEVLAPKSMNRYTSKDRFFDHRTKSRKVFVMEVFNKPVGYVSFHVSGKTLWLDYILMGSKEHQELKEKSIYAAAALIRFVAHYAISVGCNKVGAWAISDKLNFYTNMGFQQVAGEAITFSDQGGEEKYLLIVLRLQ